MAETSKALSRCQPERSLKNLARADAEKSKREAAEERARSSAKDAEDKKLQAEKEIEDMMADLRNKISLKDKE